MTPEDEEFQRISREIKRRSEEDDDIQDYKKPWVSLTEEEIENIEWIEGQSLYDFARFVEAKLKRKNF
jgi:hypothetical protein